MANAKLEFNTGREYSPEGQIIKAEEFNGPFDDFSWFDAAEGKEEDDQYIIFEDVSRGIKGKIKFCKLEQEDIMRNYDKGRYSDI